MKFYLKGREVKLLNRVFSEMLDDSDRVVIVRTAIYRDNGQIIGTIYDRNPKELIDEYYGYKSLKNKRVP